MQKNNSDDNFLPRDAKIISAILRSLGIEECEPKVIVQLLEFAYKYSTNVMVDALHYSRHCERETVTPKDIKLAVQTRSSQQFIPAPSRNLLQATADMINKNPLSLPDNENLIRVPNLKSGLYGAEYELNDPVDEHANINNNSTSTVFPPSNNGSTANNLSTSTGAINQGPSSGMNNSGDMPYNQQQPYNGNPGNQYNNGQQQNNQGYYTGNPYNNQGNNNNNQGNNNNKGGYQ